MVFSQKPSSQLLILILQNTISITSWKMLIIQKPYLHITFSGFLQNHFHIIPPALFSKILMWSRFYTKSPAATFIYFLNTFWYFFAVPLMYPKKRKKKIFILLFYHIFQIFIHFLSSFHILNGLIFYAFIIFISKIINDTLVHIFP